MNFYKKIIKSQETRLKILKALRMIPDKPMIRLQYKIKTGNSLNLSDPKRYTEKIQWYKLNYRTKAMTVCSDKYTVRKYLEDRGYGNILNPLYAVYDNPDDIDFEALPNQFALKCSVGSGLNYFVSDKKHENYSQLRSMMHEWFQDDSYAYGREWCYKDCKARILVERLIPRNDKNDLPDYKFFCFHGKVFCLYTMIDYTDNHENGKLGFFDRDFNQMPYFRLDFKPITEPVHKPDCFDEMVRIAEDLAKDFPHVRVDFYDVNGTVVFGELTFYNACGYTKFKPDEFDYIMGDQFILPKPVREDLIK
jgi:hypothetical protein